MSSRNKPCSGGAKKVVDIWGVKRLECVRCGCRTYPTSTYAVVEQVESADRAFFAAANKRRDGRKFLNRRIGLKKAAAYFSSAIEYPIVLVGTTRVTAVFKDGTMQHFPIKKVKRG